MYFDQQQVTQQVTGASPYPGTPDFQNGYPEEIQSNYSVSEAYLEAYSQLGSLPSYPESVVSNRQIMSPQPGLSDSEVDSGLGSSGKWSPASNEAPYPPLSGPMKYQNPSNTDPVYDQEQPNQAPVMNNSQIAQQMGLLPIQPDYVYPQSCIFCIIGCPHPTADDVTALQNGSWFNILTPEQFSQVLSFINPQQLTGSLPPQPVPGLMTEIDPKMQNNQMQYPTSPEPYLDGPGLVSDQPGQPIPDQY